MSYIDDEKQELCIDEGDRKKLYIDTKGKTSIGIGRNLIDVGISEDEEQLMFANDAGRADSTARALFPTFDTLSDNRKGVLFNMSFNMGYETLSEFVGLIAAVGAADFNSAADHMQASKWAGEVGDRATRLINRMRNDHA